MTSSTLTFTIIGFLSDREWQYIASGVVDLTSRVHLFYETRQLRKYEDREFIYLLHHLANASQSVSTLSQYAWNTNK